MIKINEVDNNKGKGKVPLGSEKRSAHSQVNSQHAERLLPPGGLLRPRNSLTAPLSGPDIQLFNILKHEITQF